MSHVAPQRGVLRYHRLLRRIVVALAHRSEPKTYERGFTMGLAGTTHRIDERVLPERKKAFGYPPNLG